MKQVFKSISIPLSRLASSKRNPRKVKPSQQSHETLVALIRAHGLLQPLVVRPVDGKAQQYEVVAGHRRLRALKEVHRQDGDVRIPCVVRKVDAETADALSLGENFGREPMHPLDEAEAFDKLASGDGKDADTIAAEFGVEVRYVRQRMKLAGLRKEVKDAYRDGQISTAISSNGRHSPGTYAQGKPPPRLRSSSRMPWSAKSDKTDRSPRIASAQERGLRDCEPT